MLAENAISLAERACVVDSRLDILLWWIERGEEMGLAITRSVA